MSILEELASAVGVRTQEPNDEAAARCQGRPRLLDEIAVGLAGKDARLAGDCAEVMTKVAASRPELIAPFAEALLAQLSHKNGRVRWESAHAFSLVAAQVPKLVLRELDALAKIAREDESVIVRDYVLDAVGAWGATDPKAAAKAFPVLSRALGDWEGKHAARVLTALCGLVKAAPGRATDARRLAQQFAEHERAGVRKAAKALLKATAAS
jgi:hypothetical protein